ncbi:MAG TPA: DinB family protein [Planctomycetota bacterium]|nr:DinB family protein [Planctomycetota bacterium]
MLDTAYDHTSWHGVNLRGALRRVPLNMAVWRPRPGAHNVWELMVHAAYWKYAAWRRLSGAARGSFPLAGSNWFARPTVRTARAWAGDLRLLDDMHRQLRDAVRHAVSTATSGRLDRPLPRGRTTPLALITGVAAHDLYHAGQIQLLKKLFRVSTARGSR